MIKRTDILNILYNHQKIAVDLALSNNRAQFILPTGTGKTFIQVANIGLDMIDYPDNDTYIIQVPRILLSYQIFEELFFFLRQFNLESDFLIVHSGTKIDDGDLLERLQDKQSLSVQSGNTSYGDMKWTEIPVTTSTDDIEKQFIDSKKRKRPLIIVQTYNSAHKTFNVLENLGFRSRMIQNDECQYLVSEEFNHLLNMDCDKMFSFTATAKNTERIGMNNTDLWGNVLQKMTPREAIESGLIVRPRMIYMGSKSPIEKDEVDRLMPLFIRQDFESLKEHSPNVNAKVLICTRGTNDIHNFMNSYESIDLMNQGVNIFAIGSNPKVDNWYNGVKMNRNEWLRILQDTGKDESAEMIVLHIDILSEGIDVPGFTGISFFSTKEKDKFIQCYGRSARLSKRDRDRLKTGEINTVDLSNWEKPYSYVILHEFNETDKSQSEGLAMMVNNLREYGFDPSRDIIIKSQRGSGESEELEILTLDDIDKTKKRLVSKYETWFKVEAEHQARLSANISDKTFTEMDHVMLSYFN